MEQQNEVLTNEIVASKVVVKKTIPQKQKTTIKLVMWALSHVMEREAMLVKIDEIFKLKDTSIETIIEMVDAVEKSAEYLVMDTELGALTQKKKSRREKVTGDPDTIIKQLVDMAKDEVKPAKKTKAKASTKAVAAVVEEVASLEEAEPVKTNQTCTKATKATKATKKVKDEPAPQVRLEDLTLKDAQLESPVVEDKKKPKAKAKAVAAVVVTDTPVAEEDKKKPKAKAKKVAAVSTEADAVVVTDTAEDADKKKPKAKAKPKAKEEVPVVVHEVEESLEEDEYLLLNEVVVEGETYMVDSNQNIYDEFNKIIGKYDNGVVVLNA